jgi:RNA polymerase sigma factor (sigma-70 family)
MGMLKEGTDDKLVMLASGGNSLAKNALMSRYQPFVLKLVKRMKVEEPEDAVQDILLKVFLNLHQFESRSLFTTWLYRITVNHILQLKKRSKQIHNEFSGIDNTWSSNGDSSPEKIKGYMRGMITCLQSDQRVTLILAEHFQMDHNTAAELLLITPANFRKRLSRARKELRHWTNNKCSLLGQGSKGCHCTKKTRYFISQGWVDQSTRKFTKERLTEINRFIQTQYFQMGQPPSIT